MRIVSCHECRHFVYDDVREWPKGACDKVGDIVSGLKMFMCRPRPVSRKRPCVHFDPHGLEDDGFPLTIREYSMAHFEWDGE